MNGLPVAATNVGVVVAAISETLPCSEPDELPIHMLLEWSTTTDWAPLCPPAAVAVAVQGRAEQMNCVVAVPLLLLSQRSL